MENTKYVPTIGLEIHAELKTDSKMFCSCKNDPDEERPNTNVCPICLGHPGTLPVLNLEAIKHVLKMGIAVGGDLADFTEWDRKNYFYPDIPKGYQLSQYKYPLVSNGQIGGVKLERIHLEEDTAQSTHDSAHASHASLSLVNFNRSGVPLMELVTKPVIHDAKTAVAFAKELQLLLRYLKAGEANMEKGEMRVEANISIATVEDTEKRKFGTKTEIKNLNSFKAVENSIASEIERQTSLLNEGSEVKQETRGYDESTGKTYPMRSKESSHDYRYFPDPDIPKLMISSMPELSVDALKKDLPETPWSKRERLVRDFSLTEKESAVFIESSALASYFESVIAPFKADPKKVKLSVNYILSDYLGLLKKASVEFASLKSDDALFISPPFFSELVTMIASGEVSSRGAKDLLEHMIKDKELAPKALAEKHGLIQKSSAADLVPAIDKLISENQAAVKDYKAGKAASLQFLIGMAMKATKGSANPEVVKKLLLEKLQ